MPSQALAAVGKSEAVPIFELLGEIGTVSSEQIALRDAFQFGLAVYRGGDWNRAEAAFVDCLRIVPGDVPATAFLSRVATIRHSPPADNWGGVWLGVAK